MTVQALPAQCDLLVVGSGAGALSAAVTAAHLGLQVVVVEKEPVLGGTTAWSGGWMWIPRNPLARAAGIDEDVEAVRRYLRHITGAHYDAARLEMFLAHGPQMVDFHLKHTALRFIDGNAIPDFHGRAPGARTGGRSVCAAPFDASVLGRDLQRLRPPRDILSFWGMSIGGDLRHFLRSGRAFDSLRYVVGRVVRHMGQVLRHGQGTTRMAGNALAAALLKSALDKGVQFHTAHPAVGLLTETEGGRARVVGARIRTPQGERTIRATRGVVLGAGGFPHDPQRQRELFACTEHHSAACLGNTGDGLRMGESAGAQVDGTVAQPGAWAPVSLVPRRDGSVAHFPHLIERGKPGLIAVDRDGRRFVDEAGDYHSFMRALFARSAQKHPGQPVEAWLVCDHRFQRRYGLGHSKPFPLPIGWHLHTGYLQRADTLEGLARACGIDPQGLARQVAGYNVHAREGRDPQFHRGEVPYDRMQGDAEHDGPNPCVAPIERSPFYAVRVVPGSLGTFAGLRGDAHGRVLDAQGQAIAGLYAAGNDMASVMGGHYPSGGITLGPAMTFGYILAHHAAGRALPEPQPAAADSSTESLTAAAAAAATATVPSSSPTELA